jgi:predicted MFS family arabinose efflux permease
MAIGIYQAGYPLGAVLTGFACISAIPRIGWQATLVGAGCASLVLLPVIWWLLPESTRPLDRRSAAVDRKAARKPSRLGELFANGMWVKSVLLWLATLLAYATLYFVTSWIPKLAMKAGLDASDALYASTIFNLGGLLGGLLMGRLAQRHRVGMVIASFFVVSAVTMLLFSIPAVLLVALALAFLMGLTLQGGFTGFYSLSALLYPAEVRSSGIGWAVGIGRAGSIVGPLLGGFLLSHDFSLWATFLSFAIPLVIAGILAERVGRAVPPPIRNDEVLV